MTGMKFDTDKPRCGMVLHGFARALGMVCAVGEMGAKKYAPNNWQLVEGGVERYTDAMHRHWLAEARGEALDPESGLPHAAHCAWNALARLDLMIRAEEETHA